MYDHLDTSREQRDDRYEREYEHYQQHKEELNCVPSGMELLIKELGTGRYPVKNSQGNKRS